MAFSVSELARLHHQEPNTDEMAPVYAEVIRSIEVIGPDDDACFFAIDSPGGTGKSTFAKKVFYDTRSKGKIVLGGAATGLATQVFYKLINCRYSVFYIVQPLYHRCIPQK